MKITILGTASGVPVQNRKSSAVLLECNDAGLLFDAGEGVTASLQALGKDIDSVKRIYVSHTHPDHVSGLPMLLQSMHLGGRKEPLYIVCDQRIHVWLLAMLRGMFLVPVDWDFQVHVVNLSFTDFPDVFTTDVVAIENTHLERIKAKNRDYGVPAVCYSFIVKGKGVSIFLSSDVGSIGDVDAHFQSVSAAVVECTHISFDVLLQAMRQAPDTKFVITHIPPEMEPELDRYKNILQAEIGPRAEFATDGYTLTLAESEAHG